MSSLEVAILQKQNHVFKVPLIKSKGGGVMDYYDLAWIGIGRGFAAILFLGIVLYLIGSVRSFFRNPRCPNCGSRKQYDGIVADRKPAEYCCGQCGYWYDKAKL